MSKEPGFYYKNIDEKIRKSLNYEQKRAVISCLNDINKEVKVPNKLVEIKFTFWFIKRYYIFCCMGRDKRNQYRTKGGVRPFNNFILFLRFLLFLSFILLFLAGVFYLLYSIKCFLGFDLFKSFHLCDLFPNIF